MSVIRYTENEMLSALAATWNRGSAGSSDAIRYMGYLAEQGNAILRANGQAYEATYNEAPVEQAQITAADVKRALIRFTVADKLTGMRTLRGLRYNLIANNGQDFATAEILDTLLTLMTAAYELTNRSVAA